VKHFGRNAVLCNVNSDSYQTAVMSMVCELIALWEPTGREDLGKRRREVRPGNAIQACLLLAGVRTPSAELISERQPVRWDNRTRIIQEKKENGDGERK
jgi:hypothetical protein